MSAVKRGLTAVALAAAALVGSNATAFAGEWVYIGTYGLGECQLRGSWYADGSTGYDCRYNAGKMLYDLYVGP